VIDKGRQLDEKKVARMELNGGRLTEIHKGRGGLVDYEMPYHVAVMATRPMKHLQVVARVVVRHQDKAVGRVDGGTAW
jgi:hypothetical protein